MDVFQGNTPLKFMSHVNRKPSHFHHFPLSVHSTINIKSSAWSSERSKGERKKPEQKIQTIVSRKCSVGNLLLLMVMTNVLCSGHGQDRQSLAMVRLPLSGLVTSLWSQGFRDSQISFLEVFWKLKSIFVYRCSSMHYCKRNTQIDIHIKIGFS